MTSSLHVGGPPSWERRLDGFNSFYSCGGKAECDKQLRIMRTDNGREFTYEEFARHYEEHGVQCQFIAPYSRSKISL